MRVWDVNAGFLNDKSLLGEHREIHAISVILHQGKTGYSRHPETLRWKNNLEALHIRHDLLVEEMILRGFNHNSPLSSPDSVLSVQWPRRVIDRPFRQYEILEAKYHDKPEGRIPLPKNIQELWACHKYSVLARNPEIYKKIGPDVSLGRISFNSLSNLLIDLLRMPPIKGRLRNSLQHMWGYLKNRKSIEIETTDFHTLFKIIQQESLVQGTDYLIRSTALGELGFWCSILDKEH